MKKLLIVLLILLAFHFVTTQKLPFKSLRNDPVVNNTTVVNNEESATIQAIQKALPSVVTIRIDKTTSNPGRIELDPFDPFSPFRRIPSSEQKVEQNIGSGFIIDKDGLIVTNKHVVIDTEATYEVLTHDNKTFAVQKVSRDPLNDLAILKIDAKNLTPLSLANSSQLKLGQHVIAIGTPFGDFTNSVTAGIISGLGRGITAGSPYEQFVERLDNVIQTDAAINPGNSGGALINLSGQAVGVNTAVSGQGQNIGFAIPINVVKDLLNNFDKIEGKVNRPFVGIRYQIISKQNALTNEVPEGARIIEVVSDSPAQKADLQIEDIITEFEGVRVNEKDDKIIQNKIATHKIGDRIPIKIWREGKILEKTITLEAFQ